MIIEIALGIVRAFFILACLPYILGGAVTLAIAVVGFTLASAIYQALPPAVSMGIVVLTAFAALMWHAQSDAEQCVAREKFASVRRSIRRGVSRGGLRG
jgi:hypothetical protein